MKGRLSFIRFAAIALLLAVPTMTAWAQGTAHVSTYAELSAAVSNASVNNIVVTANINVPCETSVTSTSNEDRTGSSTAQLVINRSLTIQSQAGYKYTIKRIAANGATTDRLKSLISVRGNGSEARGTDNLTENTVEVTFTNIIIDGGANWGSSTVSDRRTAATTAYGNAGRAMIDVFMGGTLNLEDGVVLQNGFTTYSINSVVNNSGSYNYGGAVRVEYDANYGGGTVNLKAGATIHDCSAQGANNTSGYGGALGAYNFARLNVYGGTIYNCSAASGGAIGCTWRSGSDHKTSGTINLFGGTIRDCYANKGGAILTEGTVEDYLLGGTISNCSATTEGGAIAIPEKDTQVHIVDHSSGWLTFSDCSPDVAGTASTGYYPFVSMNADATISTTPVYQVTFRNNNTDFAVLHVLQGNSLGEAFPAAPVKAGLRFLGWYNGNTQITSSSSITENITVTAKWDFLGSGTSADPYLIPSAEAWDLLADKVNAGTTYSGKYFQLTADIGTVQAPITRMVGVYSDAESEKRPFSGTFDGLGHTLTLDYSGNDYETRTALFSYVKVATIRNLIVAGNCGTAGRAAGIVGESDESDGLNTVTNCVSSVTISGGLVGGIALGGNVDISGCLFNGTINGTSQSGGIVCWGKNVTKITNCLFAPQAGSSIIGGTFYCTDGGAATVTNCYYTTALGTAQGTLATFSSDKPANIGTQTAVYSVSGITVYTNGLCQAGQYICSSPEYNYSLPVASAIIMGESKYVTTFYHGTLDYELPTGALAYTAGKDGDKVVFYRIGPDSNIIPHNTAVIIVADASAVSEGKVPLTKITSAGVTPGINILTGSDTDVTELTGNEYVLGIAGGVIGFYPFTGSAIPAGKAYYVVN